MALNSTTDAVADEYRLVTTIGNRNTVRATSYDIEQHFVRICSALAGKVPPFVQGATKYKDNCVFLVTIDKGAQLEDFIRNVEQLNNGYAIIEFRIAAKFQIQ